MLLAVAGHMIGGLITIFFLVIQSSIRAERRLPKMLWNLVVVCVASAVVAYLTARYVSVRTPAPTDPH